jgi:Tol biopolymer transport system component
VDLTISRNGELWYVAGGQGVARQELVWATRDGQTRVTDPEISGNFVAVALSPDGTRIAFIERSEAGGTVWVTRVGSQSRDRLTFDRSFQALSWSPNGRDLLLVERRGGVFTVPADGSALATPFPRMPRDVDDVHWSPDGKWVTWSGAKGASNHIFGLRPGVDTMPVALITTANSQWMPAVSPDGRWIAFQSARAGLGELYVRPFPNTNGTLRQISGSFARQPRWSKDGREFFYRSYNDSLYVVPVLSGTTFTPGPPRALFRISGVSTWDVTADAKRFILVRARAAAVSRQLIVVENFFEELRARVKR